MKRFCELVERCESTLKRSHYNKEVLMFWYGILTEAIAHLDLTNCETFPDEIWEKYEAICEMGSRIIKEVNFYY